MKNTFKTVAITLTTLCLLSSPSYSKDHLKQNSNHNNNSSYAENLVSDTAITLSIKKQYAMDNRINSFNLNVTTINGDVYLEGTVPNEESKDVIISLAQNTSGVNNVSSNLKITDKSLIHEASQDAILTTKIKLTYLEDDVINFNDIKVKTTNGKVQLSGKVPSPEVKDMAIRLALATPGVKDVVSNIKIDKSVESSSVSNLRSDSSITTLIKLKFLEDENLDGLDIHVKTVNGEVNLKGIVNDTKLRDRAISIAKNTNGVKGVVSNITVKKQQKK